MNLRRDRCDECTRRNLQVARAEADLRQCARKAAFWAEKHGQPTERQYADLAAFRAAKAAAVNTRDDHVNHCERSSR